MTGFFRCSPQKDPPLGGIRMGCGQISALFSVVSGPIHIDTEAFGVSTPPLPEYLITKANRGVRYCSYVDSTDEWCRLVLGK